MSVCCLNSLIACNKRVGEHFKGYKQVKKFSEATGKYYDSYKITDTLF